MEESWKPYLNVIIAVHDVTAFGNTKFGTAKFGTTSLAKFLFYCIYSYQILIIIRSWRNGLLLSFKQFFGKKNYVHIYHMSYHRILRHKITTVHIVTRCLISTLKFTTLSDYRQRIRIGQVLTITRIVNGSHSWPNSPQRQSRRRKLRRDIEHIIFHTYGEDGNWLTSPRLPHTHNTNIPGGERTFITTGRVTFTCLALLVQSGRSIWNQSAAALCQISNRAAFIVDIARFS